MDKKPEKNLMDLANEAEQKANLKLDNLTTKAKEKMTLGKKIKSFIGLTALGVATASFIVGVPIGILHAGFRHTYQNQSYHPFCLYASEFDDFLGFDHTTIEFDGKITKIERDTQPDETYIDYDGDQKVDELEILGNHFYRDKHFEEHAKKFLEADKIFKEQLERFKPYIEKWKELYKQD